MSLVFVAGGSFYSFVWAEQKLYLKPFTCVHVSIIVWERYPSRFTGPCHNSMCNCFTSQVNRHYGVVMFRSFFKIFGRRLITFTASFSLFLLNRGREKNARARSRIKPLPSHVKKGHIYWERRIPWTQIVFYIKCERDLWTRDPPLEDAGQNFNGANKNDKLIEKSLIWFKANSFIFQ